MTIYNLFLFSVILTDSKLKIQKYGVQVRIADFSDQLRYTHFRIYISVSVLVTAAARKFCRSLAYTHTLNNSYYL